MDVNSYRIRSFVLAQDCPRIDGVRRLMAYSIIHTDLGSFPFYTIPIYMYIPTLSFEEVFIYLLREAPNSAARARSGYVHVYICPSRSSTHARVCT